MEFSVDRDRFFYAMGLVSGVTATKTSTLPILGNVLIESKHSNELLLAGTDLELGISTTLEAENAVEGSITVPGKKLFEILRELPLGRVDITVAKNNAVNIKAGKAMFKIMGLAKDDFPKLPEPNQEEVIEIDQAVFKECLNLTTFAISHDETRYVLNGINIQITKDLIRFVATDGRRLAFAQKKLEKENKTPTEMIVPTKATHELSKILNREGVMKIMPTKNQAVFQIGNTTLVTRLIEGHFPNYEQVIPKDEKTITQINREELLQAIRRAALLTSPDSQFVKFDFLKDRVLVSSRTPNLGEAREEVPAEGKGGELAIGFNPVYLMDVLKNLDIEKVSFSLTEPDKPGLVRGKEDYLYVVMPMQLN